MSLLLFAQWRSLETSGQMNTKLYSRIALCVIIPLAGRIIFALRNMCIATNYDYRVITP